MVAHLSRAGLLIVLAAFMLPALSGCGRFYDAGSQPAYRTYVGARSPAVTTTQRRNPIPADGMHTVERGNTVYAISRLYGIPVRAIIEANDLQPPYLLRVGDRLRLPAPRTHRVAKGDTVYSISRRYEVPMSELMRANGITPPFTIVIGQNLIIPGGQSQDTQTASAPKPTVARAPTRPAPPPKRVTPAQVAALPNPPPRSGRIFQWPVAGQVVLGFGRHDGGSHNDGINIAAPRGSRVVAAENGIVAYAGNELRGFGNLLLIKHSDGYMTAYAHNQQLLVTRGQKVSKGQVIARVGSSGNVASPQLHFEIREGRKAVDPMRYLPRQSASR